MAYLDLQTNKEAIQKRQTSRYKKNYTVKSDSSHMSEVLKDPNYYVRSSLMGFKRRRSLVAKAPV